MIARRADELALALGGRLVSGDPAARAEGLSIDSRTIEPRDVFVAIEGERFDGHAFAADAASKGSGIVVTSRDVALPAGVVLIVVDDTTRALGALARDERRRLGVRVVAITGSSGKTTTRALCAAALAGTLAVASSTGNLNNQWGLPLSLLGLPQDLDVAVLEMGMNHAGEIADLTGIAEPEIGVITNVGTAHIGFFESVAAIADAKCELLDGLPPDGLGIVHAGSPELMERARRSEARLVTFGRAGEGADLEGRLIESDLVKGMRFEARGLEISLALWGEHAMLNALAALGVAEALDVPLEAAAHAMSRVQALEGRGRVLRLGRDVTLVDECYNANPSAMRAVLAALAQSRSAGRRVAVLGDMKELGAREVEYHGALGADAAALGIELLFAVGDLAHEVARGAKKAGLDDVVTCRDADEAATTLPSRVADGDLVVIKGSRSVGLERVRDALRALLGEEVQA